MGFSTVIPRVITDFQQFQLLEVIIYTSLDGTVYEMPINTQSDLASTPSAIWGAPLFLVPNGWWAIATYLHDAAYRNMLNKVNPDTTVVKAALTREQCDNLLREAMNSLKPYATDFEKLQLEAIYEGVCHGGYHAFKEDRS